MIAILGEEGRGARYQFLEFWKGTGK